MKEQSNSEVKLARGIKRDAERELWGRAAARCQFSDCDRLLYKSPVTQESGNFAEMAHIYSFAKNGPRGWGPFAFNKKGLNQAGNLLLVCHDCHKKIDADKKGERYSADLLKEWKAEHERRVRIASGIRPDKKSHVVLYGARIGEEESPLSYRAAAEGMFPDWYPVDDRSVDLSMSSALDDSEPGYWTAQESHLRKEFDRQIVPRIKEKAPNHFSVFSLAPQPLLIQLGALLTDKVPAVVYQPHREPQTWKWQPHLDGFKFIIHEPEDRSGEPVLVFSLSGKIDHSRIEAVLGVGVSIWEVTVDDPHNDFIRSEAQVSMFRETMRKLIAKIQAEHSTAVDLKLFPAMPVTCAVELGRIRMPQADLPWVIYNQSRKHQKFIQTITVGGQK